MQRCRVGVFTPEDERGRSQSVEVWQDVQNLGGGEGQRGLKSLRLPDGTGVNRLAQGHYQVLDGEFPELWSDDPAAP